ncbi:type II toxin-antitoxin system PemK/MazF family toxin [Oceanobacillus sp. CAU 1775]
MMYKQGDIIGLDITSKLKGFDYSVSLEAKDLISGQLKVTSEIRVDKIYTLSKSIIRKRFGQVNNEILDKVRINISKLIN